MDIFMLKFALELIGSTSYFERRVGAYIRTKHRHGHVAKVVLRCYCTQHHRLYTIFCNFEASTVFKIIKRVLHQSTRKFAKIPLCYTSN